MTTSTVQAPPPAPAVPATGAPEPSRAPRPVRWVLGFWAAAFTAFVAASPGRQTFDSKLGVTTDPWGFLAGLGSLWQDEGGFGGLTNQYTGYAFPMLPFHALAHAAQLPVWLAERLWLSLVVTAAFWGALRLAERLGVGSPASRLLGSAAYALWPVLTIVVGSTSAAALPGAVLPWVLLPLARADLAPRTAALRSALVIPFMGGVNAVSTLAALLPVGLYVLSRPAGPRRRGLITWWFPGALLATLWWILPLLLLGAYGENFLAYVESSDTTTGTMSATEALRGAGNWVAYLNFGEAWLPAGWTVASAWLAVLGSALAAALGLGGLARRDLPERRWLVLTALTVALVTLAGYDGSLGGPFHSPVREWLDGPLAPFRNVYKFQPGLALALALGLAHLVARAAAGRAPRTEAAFHAGATPHPGAGRGRAARRWLPVAAALLVLPGLALPYLNGNVLQPGSFSSLPQYWRATADWLEENSPESRALVVPATSHGLYTWGSPIDQPLDVLAESPWAQRDFVPFGQPGNRRAMDAVEQALQTGSQVPGLRDYLARAGLHYVVVRNDLDPDQIGHVPATTVTRTLEESGYERVTGFGPLLTAGRIADDNPLQVEGLYPRQRSVEIYAPEGVPQPGRARLLPVAETMAVSGGPEALLPLSADPELGDRPAVLTGDAHPGLDTPALQVLGDGLRRADTRFGLVNSNTSHTYTPEERNAPEAAQDPGEEPHQILPTDGVEHQTVARLTGADSVTASTSGNWLFHLPQYDPVNAFDGDPATAWAEGSAASPAGEWLRIGFEGRTDVPGTLSVTPLPGDAARPAPVRVRVETENGAVTSHLRPDGSTQQIRAEAGPSRWLRITILEVEGAHAGVGGAGFAEVGIPGVRVSRVLTLPEDAAGSGAESETVSLHRTSTAGGLAPADAEADLSRAFTTPNAGPRTVSAQAVPVPGEELDELLYAVAPDQRRRLVATADSTSRTGDVSPRNVTDGDLTTAWIAGDRPVIHLSWPGETEISEIVFAAAGGLSARPTAVEVSSPDGAAVAQVDDNGLARFNPITTDRLDITITETEQLTVHNPLADERLQLPAGVAEVYLPALEDLRTPQPEPDRFFGLPCGQGPALTVDGTAHPTSVRGTVADLIERRPVEVTLCQGGEENPELALAAGEHRVEAAGAGPLALTDVRLTLGNPDAEAAPAPARTVEVTDGEGESRRLDVGAGEASYLTIFENANDGWRAELDGEPLTALRLDGWQQAWLIPEGQGGTVSLTYEPGGTYRAGLAAGALALLVLAALALWRPRAGSSQPEQPEPPAPGAVLGTLALTLVGVAVAGPLALLVPALALVARWRPAVLAPLALLAMAAAGAIALTGAGDPVGAGRGAFGPAAQLLALTALFAALVSVGGRGGPRGRRARGSGPGQAPPPPGSRPADTAPLPRYAPGREAR
ncbi:alpha-(1-_3)-arabinofuranosyltransferase family protein [Streptomyces sp. DSM 44917]|uniref:Alpha-(1->3)-arabinofuranosyltransferase family protein n=1 Tax=Streptomyces boetiae TaxID=3075541 RepID=A0ABU2L9N0_9ACTN|nr:alpha-(1->3)-arabinofuranosyltransferase family protein [Streptomyces sp. DSM 44917]MDT0308284.1 alpha-(1->3)-arabinofuranosyltransferase family protein [Streptomyces sp. DSM 44917]